MQLYNLEIILNQDETQVLMCHRSKHPYKGKFNFPGGKIEEHENHLESAYRELFEETGITKNDVELHPFIDFTWHPVSMKMDVFIGRLKNEVTLVEEVHELHWIDINSNFFDMDKFAGEGNIGHMFEIFKITREKIFKK